MRVAAILVCFLACAVVLAAPQNRMAKLTGSVIDATDAVVPNADILVHWDTSGSEKPRFNNIGIKQDLRLKTDDYGRFASDIPPGFYDLFVSSPGFEPACRKIHLKTAGQADPRFVLKPDRLTEAARTITIIDPK